MLISCGKDTSDLNPATKKRQQFPQLSPKARLCHSKKAGRRLVAKEKIMPGR